MHKPMYSIDKVRIKLKKKKNFDGTHVRIQHPQKKITKKKIETS